ncbi:MAG: hypothetical protein IPG63_15385 [Xanthomonadales bacterium]|nr:hypothetical protein [Xanthomonadales bacterium]
MTDTESARQWIKRLQAELAELESSPDYLGTQATIEGIREEMARVERLIADAARRHSEPAPA